MRQSRVHQRIFGILAAGALLVLLGTVGLLGPVKAGGGFVARPLGVALSGAGNTLTGWVQVLTSVGSLAKQNQQLRTENAALRQQLSQAAEFRAQNEELRQQLNVGGIRTDSLAAAEVIGYQPDNFRQFITIGRGSSDGIKAGMAVVSQGALVGTVQEVTPTTAKVFLLIDPNFRVTALDQDSPTSGTIRGQIGNGLTMDKIAQNEQVKPGDTIVTSGTGTEIPKGLIVGRVQTVDKKDNGVFQSAQVTSSIPFSRLEIVYVVTRPQE
jgi:rod shape-determining protein MreC